MDLGTEAWVDVNYVGDATYGTAGVMLDYVLGASAPSITSARSRVGHGPRR